jgi:hypothetical protein
MMSKVNTLGVITLLVKAYIIFSFIIALSRPNEITQAIMNALYLVFTRCLNRITDGTSTTLSKAFITPFWHMPGRLKTLDHDRFLPHPVLFIIH